MASELKVDYGQASRLKFNVLAPRMFEGPQGKDLQDFVELHNLELSQCHLGVVPSPSRSRFLSKKAQSYVQTIVSGTGNGPAQNYSEEYVLSDAGEAALALGQGSVGTFSLSLRCLGGYHRGDPKGSGANCWKVPAEPGWCASPGDFGCMPECALAHASLTHSAQCSRGLAGSRLSKCDDLGCSFTKRSNAVRGKTILHGCSVSVPITGSLEQMSRGRRTLEAGRIGRTLESGRRWDPAGP